jgi:D-arabinose 1-dehydrogenase-like Zn-dependent alcohol dehydrogenase
MQVVDLPQPEPNQGEALVRVHSSGICHTDVEILRGNYPTLYPVVPGHEFAGTVEAVGQAFRLIGWVNASWWIPTALAENAPHAAPAFSTSVSA